MYAQYGLNAKLVGDKNMSHFCSITRCKPVICNSSSSKVTGCEPCTMVSYLAGALGIFLKIIRPPGNVR
jgi:hypothetical protein